MGSTTYIHELEDNDRLEMGVWVAILLGWGIGRGMDRQEKMEWILWL